MQVLLPGQLGVAAMFPQNTVTDIRVTAPFVGPVTLYFSPPSGSPPLAVLHLLGGGGYQNATIPSPKNSLAAQVNSFSPFVLVPQSDMPAPPLPPSGIYKEGACFVLV